MNIMEQLEPHQKQEWKVFSDHWVRTGCTGLWDAVFIAFRDYRDASSSRRLKILQEKTKLDFPPNEEWVTTFFKTLQDDYSMEEDEDDIKTNFFYFLPLKLIVSEILPYTLKFIEKYNEEDNDRGMTPIYEEIIDKCLVLAKYRQKKKALNQVEDLEHQFRDYLTRIFKKTQLFTYEDICKGMVNIEHQLIIISTEEKVLFDSKKWADAGEYQDVIIVLAHPDGTYDSIGRLSYTKDGNQKISRLFHYDDHVVEFLRS